MFAFLLVSAVLARTTSERLGWPWSGPTEAPASVRNTTSGKVQGLVDKGDGREKYMGIPFAAPPVGNNRFRAPQPHPDWSGVKQVDTVSMTRRCISVAQGGREDCLYLDVHVPANSNGEKLPVWFWIYGGGFTSGQKDGSYDNMYDPSVIMQEHRIVFVAINYRLDLFGFMAHPAFEDESINNSSSGNYGLLDQSFALEWVQKNIASFNGNPDNVMIFGQSAGATSVEFHVVSHASKGKFKSAISLSAPDMGFWQPKKVASEWAEQWAKEAGCGESLGSNAKIRECLRSMNAERLYKQRLPHPSKLSLLYPLMGWVPAIDGYYLTNTAAGMVEAGDWNKVPTMFGVEKNEGYAFALTLPTILPNGESSFYWSGLEAFSNHVFSYNDTKSKMVYDRYSSWSSDWYVPMDAAGNMITDAMFRCGARRMMRALAKQNVPGADTYYYYTNYSAPLMGLYDALGDFHGFDLLHVFEFDTAVTQVWMPGDTEMGKYLRTAYYNFGQYGGPGQDGWVPYKLGSEYGISMDGYYKPQNMNLHDPSCDFFDSLGANPWAGKNGYELVPKN